MSQQALAHMHHVALTVDHIASAIAWYRARFPCQVLYQDETWGYLKFDNINLALVIAGHHPNHIAFSQELAQLDSWGPIKPHRDGTQSTYIEDNSGNSVELIHDPAA